MPSTHSVDIAMKKHAQERALHSHCRQTHVHDYDVTYKVLMLGDSGVGKTALMHSLMGQPWIPYNPTTVGVDYMKKTFVLEGVRVELQIWDTAGQERFRSISRFHYRGTKGVLLVYDISNKASFDMLNYWNDCVNTEIDNASYEPVPVFIIGNKCDLAKGRAVTVEQGENFATQTYAHGFMETSAKDRVNVQTIFSKLALAVAEVYNPKLLDAYLSPYEKKEKYDELATDKVCNGMCACGGRPPREAQKAKMKRMSRIKLSLSDFNTRLSQTAIANARKFNCSTCKIT